MEIAGTSPSSWKTQHPTSGIYFKGQIRDHLDIYSIKIIDTKQHKYNVAKSVKMQKFTYATRQLLRLLWKQVRLWVPSEGMHLNIFSATRLQQSCVFHYFSPDRLGLTFDKDLE